MASVLRIIDLNGRTINIIKGRDQSWAEVVEKANLPKRFDFCIRHWMADDVDTQTEDKIKAYLDRVGYILIQDKPDGRVITDYKELRDKVALVPVAGISHLENIYYAYDDNTEVTPIPGRDTSAQMTKTERKVYNSLVKPRRIPKQITFLNEKRSRIETFLNEFPNAKTTHAVVNTDGEFTFDGKRYRVDAKQYEPKDVHGDLLYDMDQVICAKCDDGIRFYDQNFTSLAGHVVEVT